MTTKKVHEDDLYRYQYDGVQPLIFPDLTAHGVGVVEPGDHVDLPVPFFHDEMVPRDARTRAAVPVQEEGTEAAPEQTEEPTDAAGSGDDEKGQ